jgi:hypothetical protein
MTGLRDVIFAHQRFLAVGDAGTVLTSTDGRSWQRQPVDVEVDLLRVTSGPDRWVAVGRQGAILRSADGSTWSTVARPTATDLIDVAYGQGLYVAISSSENVAFVSADGLAWATVVLYTQGGLRAVGYAGGKFLVLGGQGQVLLSVDGYAWEAVQVDRSIFPYDGGPTKLARGRGFWLATGGGGAIVSSRDAIDFSRRVSRTVDFLIGATFFRGRFVAVGYDGTLLQSDRLGAELALTLAPAGIRVTAVGEPGEEYGLQRSEDLSTWETLQRLVLPDGTGTVLDPAGPGPARRFYRLAAP